MEQLQEYLSFSPSTNISFLLLLTSTAILLAITSLLLKRSSKNNPKTTASINHLPPGPWKLPIIGNLHQLLMAPTPPHRCLRDMANKYGPVMRLQLEELPHVVVSSAEAARDVLKTHDAVLASRPFLLAADIIFYGRTGISFTPYGEYWRRIRKICVVELLSENPSEKRVLSYRSIREEELCDNMVRRIISSAGPGRAVDLGEILFWVSNRVIARTAFGGVRENTESFLEVVHSMSDALAGLTVSDLYPSLKFLPWLTGFRAKLMGLHREADLLLEEIINEHRAKRDYSGDRSAVVDDIVDVLLDLQENCTNLESPLTNENIKPVATELFLAGSGTSSVTLEWIMSELMRNPRVMHKVQEEVRGAFRGEGKVDEKGVDDLKYMNAVIKEVLRLHPDGPLLAPRESQEDLVVNGYLVPARTKVIVNVWAIGRDSHSWVDPEIFYPERFLDCSVDYKGRDFQFLPFGGGRRICAGISFGMAIVKFGLANLLYHFNWKLPDDMESKDLDMIERFGLTLRRNSPLFLIPVAINPTS